jgi:predicted dehydrogenase
MTTELVSRRDFGKVAAGKHVCCEKKPVAVDAPGAYHVIGIGEKAQGKISLAVEF